MRIHHATLAKAKKFKITLVIEDNEVVATGPKGERLASGMQGNKVLEEAITRLTGKPGKGRDAKVATTLTKPARKRPIRDEEEDDEGADEVEEIEADDAEAELEDEEPTGDRSVVKAKYKKAYKPHKDKNGDELSFRINDHVSKLDKDGETRISLALLRKFAEANGCWNPSYASLRSRTGDWNAGMARMNVANRLRAKIRRAKADGEEFEIIWA